MLLQAAQAFFIAAHAAVDAASLPGSDLAEPGGVGQQLAAHGGAGDAACGKLRFDKIGAGQPAHAGDGLSSKAAHLVAVF